MQAVSFDLYETLVTHFDPAWAPPATTIAQRLGLDERTWADSWRRFDSAWQSGEIATYAEALSAMCASAGRRSYPEVLRQLEQEYQHQTQQVFDAIEQDIVDLVVTLKQRGLKLGIITNASDLDVAPWATCHLASYFDDIASCQVGLLKRDAQIFCLACQRLGVEPADAIFVGDGGGNELAASMAVLKGYWCTWFLDRWPEGIRPNGFPGDAWRQHAGVQSPFERVQRPSDLLSTYDE